MSRFPKTKQEAEQMLLDAKMYRAVDAIADIGKLFDDEDGCLPEVAEEIIEELNSAINNLAAKLSRLDRGR